MESTATAGPTDPDRMGVDLALGEIHTGLLQNSVPVTGDVSELVLARAANQRVRRWERPIRYAASAPMLTGVDCDLPDLSGASRRAVGTVATATRLTTGQLLQACAWTGVERATADRRLSWSHYLARPAALQAFGQVRPAEIVAGFHSGQPPAAVLDLAGICGAAMAVVQSSPEVDRRRPMHAARTRFRWSAVRRDGAPTFRLVIGPGNLRGLELEIADPGAEAVLDLCLDIALHDWLLTCVSEVIEVAGIGYRPRSAVVGRLRPLVDHLMHAWMPAARLDDTVRPIWERIDRQGGYTRQWATLMHRIRDQLALAGLDR